MTPPAIQPQQVQPPVAAFDGDDAGCQRMFLIKFPRQRPRRGYPGGSPW